MKIRWKSISSRQKLVVIEISFHHVSNPIQDMDIKDLIAKLSDLSVSETFVTPSVPLENTCFKLMESAHCR